MEQPTLTWYLPSFYGDIRLERVSNQETRLILVGLSSTEKIAIAALTKEAQRAGISKRPWSNADALAGIDLDALTEQSIVLGAPISKVQRALEKPLKPGRDSLSVVRYKNGHIEEVSDRTIGLLDADPLPEPARETEAKPKPKSPPVAAVTVAQPTQGCPAPDFDAVDLRASRVLRAFLTPDQVRDFEQHQSFVVRGADTGHLYQVTSRAAPSRLHVVHRSLFDLTEGMPYCVHDWTVPPAEEMLALALFVQSPGRESYVRHISEQQYGAGHG